MATTYKLPAGKVKSAITGRPVLPSFANAKKAAAEIFKSELPIAWRQIAAYWEREGKVIEYKYHDHELPSDFRKDESSTKDLEIYFKYNKSKYSKYATSINYYLIGKEEAIKKFTDRIYAEYHPQAYSTYFRKVGDEDNNMIYLGWHTFTSD